MIKIKGKIKITYFKKYGDNIMEKIEDENLI